MLPIIALLVFTLSAAIARPLTVLVHELGHALPALLFTAEPVNVFVGSYGNVKESKIVRRGRLSVYHRNLPIFWKTGLCAHAPVGARWKDALIILGGPLASAALAVPGAILLFDPDMYATVRMMAFVIGGSAAFDFAFNIVPDVEPVPLHGGKTIYNDGYQLWQLFRGKGRNRKNS